MRNAKNTNTATCSDGCACEGRETSPTTTCNGPQGCAGECTCTWGVPAPTDAVEGRLRLTLKTYINQPFGA